jgi:hypothetical protein
MAPSSLTSDIFRYCLFFYQGYVKLMIGGAVPALVAQLPALVAQ